MDRAKRYLNLRDKVQSLANINKKECSTNDLIKQLDPLWRAMLRVRSAIKRQLDEDGNTSSYEALDFYTLYCRLNNSKGKGVLCSECLSQFTNDNVFCPFCGKPVEDMESADVDVVIDFEAFTPDWEVKAGVKDVVRNPDAVIPKEIKPITKRDDIPGPKGQKMDYSRRKYTLSTSTIKYMRWARRREICANFPYTVELLTSYNKMKDLRAIAAACAERYNDVRFLNRDEAIRFILGHQPSGPVDPGPPPYGRMPEILEKLYEEES